MRYQATERPRTSVRIDGQNDPVGTGSAPGVHRSARKDGELVQTAARAVREYETFTVVEDVGVIALSWGVLVGTGVYGRVGPRVMKGVGNDGDERY